MLDPRREYRQDDRSLEMKGSEESRESGRWEKRGRGGCSSYLDRRFTLRAHRRSERATRERADRREWRGRAPLYPTQGHPLNRISETRETRERGRREGEVERERDRQKRGIGRGSIRTVPRIIPPASTLARYTLSISLCFACTN